MLPINEIIDDIVDVNIIHDAKKNFFHYIIMDN